MNPDSIDTAHLDGPFVPGATFSWHTYDLHINSTIYRVEPERHTVWGGTTVGITGIHAWTFTPVPGGVRVATEESWSGDPVRLRSPPSRKDWTRRSPAGSPTSPPPPRARLRK